jgi:flagellar protein FliL
MATVDGPAQNATTARGRGSVFRSWQIIAVLLVFLAACAGGAGYWFFLLRSSANSAENQPAKPEISLPFYLEIKPFVVTIANNAGTPHFVQVGVNLALSGSDVGNAVTAILPEVQDALRQSAVSFKADDIVTPAGIDRLRQAMIEDANRVLLQRLGPDRVSRLIGGERNGKLIQNIYFTTLIVE